MGLTIRPTHWGSTVSLSCVIYRSFTIFFRLIIVQQFKAKCLWFNYTACTTADGGYRRIFLVVHWLLQWGQCIRCCRWVSDNLSRSVLTYPVPCISATVSCPPFATYFSTLSGVSKLTSHTVTYSHSNVTKHGQLIALKSVNNSQNAAILQWSWYI